MKNTRTWSLILLLVGIMACVFSFQKYADYRRNSSYALREQYLYDRKSSELAERSRQNLPDRGQRQELYDKQYRMFQTQDMAKASLNMSVLAGFLGVGLMIFSVALVILQLKKIALADYLPSLIYAPLIT